MRRTESPWILFLFAAWTLPLGLPSSLAGWSEGSDAGRGSGAAGAWTACSGAPDGTACDDLDACTTNDRCRGGQCLAASDGSFTEAVGYPLSETTGVWDVAVGDFNLDGKLDLAVADHDNNGSGEVTVFLGDGGGSFAQAPGSPFATGGGPMQVVVADFDRNDQPDLATANFYSGNVTILRGDGAGHFTPVPGSPVAAGTNPRGLVTADFNLDSNPDLAVVNETSHNLTILLGDGAGGFTSVPSHVSIGTQPSSLAAADFNLDGKPDLAIANEVGPPSTVRIVLGTGTGSFSLAPGSPVGVAYLPQTLAAGDFNLDGKPDLAVGSYADDVVTVFLGDGGGRLSRAPGSPLAVGGHPLDLAIADFNLDGKPDLAVAPVPGMVLLGDGTGRFAAVPGSPATPGGVVASADFDRDLRPDLAIGGPGNLVSILLATRAVLDCDDAHPCTADRCDPQTACVHTTIPAGGSCSDGNACTTLDTCTEQEVCVGGPPPDCDDGSPCTIDTCVAPTGCANTYACDDGEPCTADRCDAQAGCVHEPLTPPGEVGPMFFSRLPFPGHVLFWDAVPSATSYDAVRGDPRGLPVGPGGADEACMSSQIGPTSLIDPSDPSGGFFYLVRAKNQTCPGTWGTERHNVPGPPSFPERNTTTCP